MPEIGLAKAKKTLGEILAREWTLRGSAPEEYRRVWTAQNPSIKLYEELKELNTANLPPHITPLYKELEQSHTNLLQIVMSSKSYLRKNIPELIGLGTSQIVLYLGEDYVGKTRVVEQTSDHYVISVAGLYSELLQNSVKILRGLEAELGVEVPEHNFVGIEHENETFTVIDELNARVLGYAFVIAPNLTMGGKYAVEDLRNEHFELTNGQQLKYEFDNAAGLIRAIHGGRHASYSMSILRHLELEEAIRRMFFVQIGPNTSIGKLILGDLDHILFLMKNPPLQN